MMHSNTFQHLHLRAAHSNQPGATWSLIQYGALVNDIDTNGNTALHYAAECGPKGCIAVLLNNKANMLVYNNFMQSPYYLWMHSGKEKDVTIESYLMYDLETHAKMVNDFLKRRYQEIKLESSHRKADININYSLLKKYGISIVDGKASWDDERKEEMLDETKEEILDETKEEMSSLACFSTLRLRRKGNHPFKASNT
jgi:ankyrin repeat protein